MKSIEHHSDDRAPEQVARKATRLRRARRHRGLRLRRLALSGVLGFVFAVPVVLGAFVAQWLRTVTEVRALVLLPVTLGALIGGYLVFRQIRSELQEEQDD